jgi:hypothetical protein
LALVDENSEDILSKQGGGEEPQGDNRNT